MEDQRAIPEAESTPIDFYGPAPTPTASTQVFPGYSSQAYAPFAPPHDLRFMAIGGTDEARFSESFSFPPAYPDQRRITRTGPTSPLATYDWGQRHTWIEPIPEVPRISRSPFLVDSQHLMSPPMSAPAITLKIVPRPAGEYEAMLWGMATGNLDIPAFATRPKAAKQVSSAQAPQHLPRIAHDLLLSGYVSSDFGQHFLPVYGSAPQSLQPGVV